MNGNTLIDPFYLDGEKFVSIDPLAVVMMVAYGMDTDIFYILESEN